MSHPLAVASMERVALGHGAKGSDFGNQVNRKKTLPDFGAPQNSENVTPQCAASAALVEVILATADVSTTLDAEPTASIR